jgi:hypothetical protein
MQIMVKHLMVYHCRSHALRRVLFTLDIGVAPLGVTAFVRVLARAALASNSKILSPTFRSNHIPVGEDLALMEDTRPILGWQLMILDKPCHSHSLDSTMGFTQSVNTGVG